MYSTKTVFLQRDHCFIPGPGIWSSDGRNKGFILWLVYKVIRIVPYCCTFGSHKLNCLHSKKKKVSEIWDRTIIHQTNNRGRCGFLLELMNSPKWLKFIGDRKVHSVRDALQYICARMLPQLRHLGFSNYTILLKSNQQKIGTCGLFDREGLEGIDIGFALLPDFEKQGYAFEAKRALCAMLFLNYLESDYSVRSPLMTIIHPRN